MKTAISRAGWTVAALALLANGSLFAQSALTPEQLTLRVERLTELSQRSDAKLSAAQSQLKELSDEMKRLGRMADNPALLEMIQQVDQISEDVSLLRGEIEVQGNDLNELKKRQRELYQDIDRRLRELENRPQGQVPAAQGGVPQVTTPPPAPDASSTASTGASGSTAPAPAPAPTPAAAPSPTEAEERVAYQAAFDTLKEGRYKDAKVQLRAFLDKYPNSSFAGNAQYWLGEAHYVTRNFEQGIVEFETVMNRYPGSNKVPDAMLKLGYTFYELKRYPEAKAILQSLRERFPDETAARLAGKRLERIRKEGN